MADVILIEPPATSKFGNLRTLGSIGTFKADMAWPPLELMIISGYLSKNGIKTEILDAVSLRKGPEHIKSFIAEHNPSLVVFTTSTPTIYNDLKTADIAKSVSRHIKTAAIGTHIMALPEETLKLCGNLDIACYSESEQVILNLVKSSYNLKDVPGIYYRKDGSIYKNSPQPACQNLDEFGMPSHDKVPLNIYRDPFLKRKPMTVTFSSRGCINQPPCIMCSACFYANDRYRSAESMLEEISWVKSLGVQELRFPFESGFNNFDIAKKLFTKMIDKNLTIPFTCNGRADRLPIDLLKLMKEAGCKAVNIGCESVDMEVLKFSQKKVTPEMVKEAVGNAKAAGLETLVYFMFGLPGETKDTMKQTLEFAKKLHADMVTFGVAIPHPKTAFYNFLEEKELLNTRQWDRYDPMFTPPYDYAGLSSREILLCARKTYRAYYLRPKYIFSRLKKNNLMADAKNFFGFSLRYLLKNG